MVFKSCLLHHLPRDQGESYLAVVSQILLPPLEGRTGLPLASVTFLDDHDLIKAVACWWHQPAFSVFVYVSWNFCFTDGFKTYRRSELGFTDIYQWGMTQYRIKDYQSVRLYHSLLSLGWSLWQSSSCLKMIFREVEDSTSWSCWWLHKSCTMLSKQLFSYLCNYQLYKTQGCVSLA